jgi:hypothetical protein
MNGESIAGSLISGGALGGLGNLLMKDGKPDPNHPASAKPNSFKDGGKVQKTGIALVHKGEEVIPVKDGDGDDDKAHNVSLHRALKHLHKGGLHEALGVPTGEKIPQDKMEQAMNSKNPHVKKMADLAHTMAGWVHH